MLVHASSCRVQRRASERSSCLSWELGSNPGEKNLMNGGRSDSIHENKILETCTCFRFFVWELKLFFFFANIDVFFV